MPGIYVGDDKVIHFTRGRGQEVGTGTFIDLLLMSSGPNTNTPCSICNNEGATTNTETNGVVSSCLNCFLSGGALYRFEYAVNPALFLAKARGGTCTLAPTDPDEVVVRRANHLLSNGFRCYNLFKSNCEDFAIYCKTGLLVAEQGVVGQSGQAISIIGGPLAAVISTPFRLVTTNIYGMAVMAVGVYCASRYAADIGNRRDVLKVEVEDLTAGLASGRIRAVENISQLVAPAEAQGIYVGDDKVIHFTRGRGQEVGTGTFIDLLLMSSGPNTNTPCSICNNEGATTNTETNGVVSSCLNCFLSGGALYRFEYAVNPALFLAKARGGTCTLAPTDPDEVVVRRANHLLSNGFRCYNLFKSNCEDFAIYCKTGLLVAEQGVVGQSGQAISIIGGPLAAVISTPFRLVTTNIYGMAVMAVGVYCASRYAADIGNRRDVLKVEVEDLTAGLASGRIRAVENISQLVAPAEAQGLTVTAPVAA
ncbi:hypothetical protein OsI_20115 [Oryza sativa Indica Group]|uniref:LRAT domain-containing protein n=1 Tax=Oryza sativa subsp. indica TaxID=39946 RepID=A2Y542_ORYSI|nr:hypothetical protein OsI_20115 [Oryza sativa Indica Group]